jgi:putative chitinase
MLALATGAGLAQATARFDGLNDAIELFRIDTEARVGMFLANIGHETMRLRYFAEIWGPTAQQLRYERDFAAPWPASPQQAKDPRFAKNRLAYRLGNSEPGDGKRFPGHGPMQNTGRTNHRLATQRLRARFPGMDVPDFEQEPLRLATPKWGWLAAAEYCERVGCWRAADEGRFDNFCDLINLGRETEDEGDSNGFADRLALWEQFNERGGLAAA